MQRLLRARDRTGESLTVGAAALLALLAVIGVGIVNPNRELHMDEAVYSFEAITMARSHQVLARHTFYGVVKPPLHLLLTAASYVIFPISKLTLWLPNIVLSLLGAILLFQFVRILVGKMAAWLGVAMLLVSWTWQFYAVSAFTDVGLAVSMLGVGLAVVCGNALWAGVAVGLAIGFKQHGVCAAAFVLAYFTFESVFLLKGRKRWLPVRLVTNGLVRVLLPVGVWTLLNGNWRMVWLQEVGTAAHFSVAAAGGRFPFWAGTLLSYAEVPSALVVAGLGGLFLLGAKFRRPVVWLLAFVLGYVCFLSCSSAREINRYVFFIVPLFLTLLATGIGCLLVLALNVRRWKKHARATMAILIALLVFMKIERLPVDGYPSPEFIKVGLESTMKVAAAWSRKEIVLVPEDLGYEYAAEAIKISPPHAPFYIHIYQDLAVRLAEEARMGNRGPFTILISKYSLPSWQSFQRWNASARPELTRLYARRQDGAMFDLVYHSGLPGSADGGPASR